MEQIVSWKGATLVRQRGMRLAAGDPAIADQFEMLQSKAAQLTELVNATPDPDEADNWRERMRKLSREKEDLETELMRKSAAFRDAMQQITLAQVKTALPKDALLVDFLEFNKDGDPHILASVIWPDRKPIILDLGPAAIVGTRIDTWRKTFGMSPQAKEAGLKIRKQIWEPLLEHIADAKTILLSPDGVLGRLPFGALPGKAPGTYLMKIIALL